MCTRPPLFLQRPGDKAIITYETWIFMREERREERRKVETEVKRGENLLNSLV